MLRRDFIPASRLADVTAEPKAKPDKNKFDDLCPWDSMIKLTFFQQRLLLFLFPLLLALPFLNRAYFVDDGYFVEIASWLKDHPLEPYHFRADDAGLQTRGWEEDGFVRMVNPLVHQYYLSLLLRIGGEKEWILRLGSVFLSCFSALFLFGLARRWTGHPFLSTVLVLVTPVHWITSYGLLIDSTLSFFFLGALYFYIRGAEKDSYGLSLVSGLLMGLAILTKYPALFILLLTLLWGILHREKITRKGVLVFPWILGLLALGLYSLWTAHLYGEPHILAASKRMVRVFGGGKVLIFFVFFSGVTLVPLVSWAVLPRRRLWTPLGLLLFLTVILASPVGGFSVLQSFLVSLWFMTSLAFLSVFWEKKGALSSPHDRFLIFWVLGFILMMFVVMGWTAARYYMIVLPAVVFLAVRLVENQWSAKAAVVFKWMVTASLVFSFLLAYADRQQANPSRDVLKTLNQKGYHGGDRHFFMGDSFTMSYFRKAGWISAFQGTRFRPGDWILSKEVTMPPIWPWSRGLVLKELDRFEYSTRFPIKVMDYQGSAGFYASVWGSLPFTFSRGPWERFRLFEVVDVTQTSSKL